MRLFQLYNHFSSNLCNIPEREWPESWKKRSYKVYTGADIKELHRPDVNTNFTETDIRKLLQRRRSARDYDKNSHISLLDLGNLIYFSCGEYTISAGKARRMYPSAGALYPIEIYILIKRNEDGLNPGIYHYRHDLHALECINTNVTNDDLFTYSWARNAPVAVFFTATYGRNIEKYGERGYRYALIEAGHISQNFGLIGAGMDIRVTSLGGTRDNMITDLIGIDGVTESLILTLMIG